MASRLWDRRVLPRLCDLVMRGAHIDRLRASVVPRARGRTLELGFGTGLNARHYGAGVDLVVVDDNPGMSALATRRLALAERQARHEVLDGARLPFAPASFDTVVVTFTLCSIPDVTSALAGVRRVLAPGGELLFLEHGLADEPSVQRWQRRLNRLWSPLAGGCVLDRAPERLLADAGFSV